ncbi:MAG: hypothetical protein LBD10_00050 [Desulfobulbus sp.]|jgi:hypothetical protein|uniref:phosphatidylinositol-specific phospholipase C/glycerophosphodiester phosphodiesterase family protein n=1 Tax=Desulfobulbus sp. TaxID=895 RepID=UPI00284A16D2|nr:phosphatidylinositol-specific phospholipase C/glycerophosphodiester phosphodiesterase family protein [Desulfobulbus sp.]MDR2548596.1 hypothetical protein [Desulfobulbus sp.]
MTTIIQHRRNTIAELEATDSRYGIEVDIRSYGQDLVTHHDPFVKGPLFADWLHSFHHNTLILNVKEEGLEERVLELMRLHGIKNFFFLDQSFPFLVKTAKTGERRCAVRVSEFESVETALTLAREVDWIWVDCFSKFPLDGASAKRLKAAGFKLCLVSPELQGRDAFSEVPRLRELLHAERITPQAVCTKEPELWC